MTSDDVTREIARFLSSRRIRKRDVHPDAADVFRREATALGTSRADWVLRAILGKATDQRITREEAEAFFFAARITPRMMLYQGRLRDGRFTQDRVRKGVPSNGANLVFSPVIAEAMADAVVERLMSYDSFRTALALESDGPPVVVFGKYLCGLVPGLLVALRLRRPYLVLSKQPFRFQVPADRTLVLVEEPHNPPGSPERYSYGAVRHGTRALIVDDELTTGKTHTNVVHALREAGVTPVGLAVFLQASRSTDAFAGLDVPFVSLHSIELDLAPLPSRPVFTRFATVSVSARQRLLPEPRSTSDRATITMTGYPLRGGTSNGAVCVDHPLKGLAEPFDPTLVIPLASQLVSALEQRLSIKAARRRYYARGKTLYVISVAPSGLMAGTILSLATRIPMLGAVDRTEPHGLPRVVNYVNSSGFSNIISWLSPGDAAILVTGELTDGEELARIVRALADHRVDVLALASVFENARCRGRATLAASGVRVTTSLQTYDADEGLPDVNISARIWAGLQYAAIQLERAVAQKDPRARVSRILVTPCSFTRGAAICGSDVDNMYVFVEKVSQTDLDRLHRRFMSWFTVEGLSFEDDNARPVLLAEHRRDLKTRYGVDRNRLITIYEGGRLVDSLAAAEASNRSFSMLYEKYVARLKLLSFCNELDETLTHRLLRAETPGDAHSAFFHRELVSFFETRASRSLHPRALALAWALDDAYHRREWTLTLPEGGEGQFEESLIILCREGLVRILEGKLILLWRIHPLEWSDRFFERQFRLASSLRSAADVLDRVVEGLPNLYPLPDRSGIRSENPYTCEAALRNLQGGDRIPQDVATDVVRQLASRSIMVAAAAYEATRGDRRNFGSELRQFMRDELARAESRATPIILAVKILSSYMNEDHDSADEITDFLYAKILKRRAMHRHLIMDETIRHLAHTEKYLRDGSLRRRVRDVVSASARSRIKRQALVAAEALRVMGLPAGPVACSDDRPQRFRRPRRARG